mmetsp:Transcript_10681/g.15587  ORF Transcript_10681/g.15587 Transcript_10681/m.15587 type:complete len:501 (+) Transcript_10681:109-1611(+)|eukprot:CAMPEP_0197238032 /NCGR_PEP_ID=MMETSP1429-20130617/4662_1 /TAXON_ID=49237 /ORGANISM="Chaetoceros  sp., Strain UNC1202" /LENGTH=500 /DNA_ID=CAMNT_0042697125 /DNA_START=35 /DNA_END=1537 /DNA_ORIENTATION=-
MTSSNSSSLFRAVLLSSGLLSLASAGKVSSSVKVHLPKDLSRASGYDHREALFGIPPYGGSIQQNVIYDQSLNLCSPVEHRGWKAPFILMVDRGDCTFVQKVRNAQHAGAAAVIIADNACQCKHEKVCTPAANTQCEKHEPIMADDGSGDDITIPSVLLFKTDADDLKKVLNRGKTVRMELAWSVPNPDDHVEWDLWTSPTDYASAQFKEEFRVAAIALGERATLTPHMYIYDGLSAKCRNKEGKSECFNLCTNNGRYCATDPDGDLDYGISGADVVYESIRRLCIWELYGDDGVGMQWWDYIKAFNEQCDNEQDFMQDECVKSVMDATDIEFDTVEQCIFNHGGLESDEANDILDKQLDEKESNGIVIMPVVYVNGVAVRGRLEFATIFKAVCAGYAEGSKPNICTKCSECKDELKCVKTGKCAVDGSVEKQTFVASLASVFIIMSAIGIFVYMRQQSQMKAQVRGILKEYMPLDINNENGSTALEQDDDMDGSGGIMS